MRQYSTSTVFMLAPQRHGSNKTQSMLSANNPALFGPYPPLPRQAFIKMEAMLGNGLLDAMVHNANLSPRPLASNGSHIGPKEVRLEMKKRGLPEDALGISIALCHVGARLSGQGEARILCKSPDNLEIVERYKDGFQDTAFIHLIRDPRAVWNSARGTPRGPQTPHASALKWADYHRRVTALSQEIPLITLTYEQLMLQPETELKRACAFLNVPFNADMLDDHGSSEAKKAAIANPGLWGNLAKPVLHNRIEAWKNELPQNEIDIVENSCASVMETFGYTPTFPSRELTEAEVDFKPEINSKALVDEPRKRQIKHIQGLQETEQATATH